MRLRKMRRRKRSKKANFYRFGNALILLSRARKQAVAYAPA